mmetsp:Transcript_23796/g.62259  ORF Transcript_23796/g.62259 Transcript_23796/m.62259 type:complete len:300 (-) Transcript_23796:130-1029(-)|eukprot:CAMPEP_0182920604 /NCGR_PEP_ID=MMETSP0105_2-20130417/3583_1 /TAXON_ID=81532 ORGANISM="Acanthoeca-like sp., Strain 10tr" /NCGR_SAMPLE_ID=MMETSP0105_2 /ASSEMBLY_ACC=CAM_ASM_000205 /LENGTH=299 /DNA_ID=CAMNT_0025058021 /DNA_START=212 /DNA_END=1111 /DNA_ORIENTATION=+
MDNDAVQNLYGTEKNPVKVGLVGRLCQLIFGILMVFGLVFFRVGTALITAARPLTGQSEYNAAHSCCCYGVVVFKTILMLCPWIRMVTMDGKPLAYPPKSSPPPFFLMNHASFMDFFTFTAQMPLRVYRETSFRTMVQSGLFKMPLYGAGMKACATFPVHFVKSEAGAFSVDKEKQAKVSEDVKEHVEAGGSIGLCPEGQITKSPPTPLQSFRRGSFAIPTENRMPIWGLTMLGTYESWPKKAAIGGLPATIYVSLDHYYTPVEGDDFKKVSEICQEKMQERLDALIAHKLAVDGKKGN